MTEKEDNLSNVQRWTAKRRAALVLSILRGETSAKEAARKHGLTCSAPRRSSHGHRFLGSVLTRALVTSSPS